MEPISVPVSTPVETCHGMSLQHGIPLQHDSPPQKFHGKYRIESTRLKDWDYSADAAYFITICTKNREHFFGEILDGEMENSEIGIVAKTCWDEIPKHFPFVILDEFVVMPNHIHGIIILNQSGRDAINRVSTDNNEPGGITKHKNPMLGQDSLSKIIRWLKGRTTYEIRKHHHPDFAWQPRFHDRVIRNEQELDRIRKYIYDNPLMWDRDRNNLDY